MDALITFSLVLFQTNLLFAYIDPGMVGGLYQMLYGVVSGIVILIVTKPWVWIKAKLNSSKYNNSPMETQKTQVMQNPSSDINSIKKEELENSQEPQCLR